MNTNEILNLIMIGVGAILIYLAIKKDMEPTLLLPMGFGAILVNLPGSVMLQDNAILQWLFNVGIESAEAFPLLLFIGIGAMIDFGPLISKPWLIFIGAAGQGGIFISMIIASLMGFPLNDAASIGIIGAADGPTAILVSQRLNSNYVGRPQAHDNKEGKGNPDALQAERSLKDNKNHLPDCHNNRLRCSCSGFSSPCRNAHVR